MKICHVITRIIVGGAQENTLLSLRGHLENGHEAVLLSGRTIGPEGNLLDEIPIPGLRVIHNDHLRREISPVHDLIALRQLQQTFADEKFDVVHTHSSKAGVLARYAAARAGIPVVVHTVHGPSFHRYQSRWKNYLYILCERFGARYSDRNYVVATAMSDMYTRNLIGKPESYVTLYSGMDLTPYLTSKQDSELARGLGLDVSAPVVGKIARLFELKGYDFFVQAAAKIATAIPNVQFLVVGDGVLRESIEKEVDRIGLRERFYFAGLVNPDSIFRYISLMDVLVHLSLREGLPRTVVQALASGKPAIGFALDGTPEAIIDGKTGFLCAPGDSTAVAERVVRLLKNPDEAARIGASGREFVRDKWDWRMMVNYLERDYTNLLGSKKQFGPEDQSEN